MNINLNDLTIGDLEQVEELSGVAGAELFSGKMSAKALKALVFVTRKKEDPTFTMEDAANVRLSDFQVEDGSDPTGTVS